MLRNVDVVDPSTYLLRVFHLFRFSVCNVGESFMNIFTALSFQKLKIYGAMTQVKSLVKDFDSSPPPPA